MPEPILLLDVGNSRLKWAWLRDDRLEAGGELPHAGQIEPDTPLPSDGTQVPRQIVAACVAGATMQASVQTWMDRLYRRPVTFLTSPARGCGLANGYARPASLGSDRWAAMVAARYRYPGDLLVVDAGSAMTLDIVRDDGRHLGGYILPGLGLMGEALQAGTDLRLETPASASDADTSPGTSTVNCIRRGILLAACSLIETVFRQLEKQGGETVQCIMTGGDHPILVSALDIPCQVEPGLVLEGLARIVLCEEPGR